MINLDQVCIYQSTIDYCRSELIFISYISPLIEIIFRSCRHNPSTDNICPHWMACVLAFYEIVDLVVRLVQRIRTSVLPVRPEYDI